jgi:PAS domain S-box-containing protein
MDIDLRRVLDSLTEPMLALDRSARIFHANEALKGLLGWSRGELLGRPVSEVVPGGLPGVGGAGGASNRSLGASSLLRRTALQRDGRQREVEVRLSPWPGGEAEGLLIASFRELDTQVELERQLDLCNRLNLLDSLVAGALSGTEDEEEAAHALLRACAKAEEWVMGTYWRMDRDDAVLRPLTLWAAAGDLGELVDATLRRTYLPPEGLPGWVWAHRVPLCISDLDHEERFLRGPLAVRRGVRGALFTPVLSHGRTYGVLELLSRVPRSDSRSDEAVASLLGHHFGRFLDRLHSEEQTHTRQRALSRLWNADLLALFISDAHGRLLDANPTLLRMLGYSRQDLHEARLSWAVLMPSRYQGVSEGALRRLRADGVYQSFECELLRKDHTPVPALVGSASLDGQRMVTFALELTDWKPLEVGPPEEAELRLGTLLSHAPVVLFSLDRDGVFTFSEGQGLEALGLRPGQVVGMSVFDVYRAEPGLLEHARRALAGEDFTATETLSNGLQWETHWAPLRDAEGRLTGTIGLALDVTQREREARWRAQLFAEAEQARAAAEEAVRLRDDFLTIASHELKTPLTSVTLQIQTLLRRVREQGPAADAQVLERLVKTERQVHKLARLMEELLDVSRVAAARLPLELEEVDLTQVAREVLERVQEEARRTGTSLELRGEGRVVGRWDRARLEQVVTNLVTNGIKYGAGAPVVVSVRSSAAMALLEVTDRGIGIAPQDLERIFGKFERAVPVRQYGGFGVGLYIVRRLVEALGGAVDVESAPGKGATFRITLPLAGPEARVETSPPSGVGLH